MKQYLAFKSWHTVLWLSLHILTLSAIIANHYWQQWADAYRAQIALGMRRYTAEADYILFHATRHWLPLVWESDQTTLENNIIQIERSIRRKYDEYEATELSNISWSKFKYLVYQWDAHHKICQIVAQLDFDNDGCLESEKLPNAWVKFFEKNFSKKYFISYVDNRPVFGNRMPQEIQYCNTAPITSRFTILKQLASPELSEFYRVAMQRPLYSFRKEKTDILHPGICRQLRVMSYDIPVGVAFHVAPQNPELEAWFFDTWKRYHANWLNNPKSYQDLVNLTRQSIATTLCDHTQQSEGIDNTISVEKLHQESCDNDLLQTYLYGKYLSSGNKIFFASNYPGFSDYSQYMNNEGELRYELLNSMLLEAREIGTIAEQQYKLAQKWNSRIPRFILGSSLNNTSGPLTLGVEASQIPQSTILSEALLIPRDGIIYQINEHPIYSIANIHEVLTRHGDSKGIIEPIKVNIYNEQSEIIDGSYTSRFRVNPLVRQHFDTTVSSFEIGTYGANFQSTGWNCIVKDVVYTVIGLFTGSDYQSQDNCSWIDQQRFAYARQMNPEKYESAISYGSFAGAIIAPGGLLKGLKLLNGGRRISTLGRILAMGGAEALIMSQYASSEGNLNELPEERFARGFQAAKEGFLFGSAFALILR